MNRSDLISKIFFSVFIFGFFFAFSLVRAQDANNYDLPSIPSLIPGLEEQIDVTVNPQNPGPNEPFSITLEAFGTDLNRADISWLVNGQVKLNGIGQKVFNYSAGNVGSSMTISIIILPVNGNKITKEVVIAPASVDIVWESPNSYVPPFYKGKALYAPEGSLNFVAIPNIISNGLKINPDTLVYKWTLNGTVFADKSGYGKNTFSYIGDVLDQAVTVEVEASDVKNNIIGDGTITVNSVNPQVYMYEDNPLYGLLFNNNISSDFSLKNQEITLNAFPYYFSAYTPKDLNVKYSWAINDNPISLPDNDNSVVFRKPDGVEGQSSISLQTINPYHFLQASANNILIDFSNKGANNVSF